MTVSDEALALAIRTYAGHRIGSLDRWPNEAAFRAAIEAVAPMIRDEERERCAKLMDARAKSYRSINDKLAEKDHGTDMLVCAALDEFAAAIRAMGEKP